MKHFLLLLFVSSFITFSQAQNNITVPQTQKSLISKRTATWCPLCGLSSAWDLKAKLIDNLSTNALVIAAHHSDASQLYSGTAMDLIDNFERSFSQPVFYYNELRMGNGSGSTEEDITSRVNAAAVQTPLAQTGLEVYYDEATRQLQMNTTTQFFSDTEGDYYVGLYLVEKEVIAPQSNQDNEAVHENVLWEALSSSSFGEQIATGSVSANTTQDLNLIFDLPEDLDINNLIFTTMIWVANENEGYNFINLNTTETYQLGLVSNTQEIQELQSFSVFPNPNQGSSQLRIELDRNISGTQILLMDLQGKQLQSIFQGQLAAGEHYFPLNIEQKGIFLLSIQTPEGLNTQKIVRF